MVHIRKDTVLRVRRAISFQAQIRKHAEPQPVSVWHLLVVHRADPSSHIALLPVAERIPEVLASNSERETDGTRLDHALVEVLHVAPELWPFGVSAGNQSLDEQMRLAVRRVAREKRRQAPEWSRIALYLRRCLVNCIVVSDAVGFWQKAHISDEPKTHI